MFIPEFACGVIFTLLVEIALLMCVSAWQNRKNHD